ncbi:MAG: penicillin-binding protein activator [Burkholderiales bacterium]|nr:penicillin-binding protein activator [Burkholderiales bacterium]
MAKSWMQSKGQIAAKSRWLTLVCALALTCTGALQANTLPPTTPNDSEPAQVEIFAVPEASQRTTPPTPTEPAPATAPAVIDVRAVPTEKVTAKRVALLLPLRSENLGQVAEVIKSGFLAAWESEQDDITVNVLESGESGADILDSYQLALAQHDVLVGPLPRAGVSSLIDSGAISKPTIALNSPEPRSPNDPPPSKLPNHLLIMGLSVEDEARQLANLAFANSGSGKKALVLSSNIAWQRRAAKAFALQWQKLCGEVMQQEINSSSGFLSAAGLATLKNLLQLNKIEKNDNADKTDKAADKPADKANDKAAEKMPNLAFIALDSEQTRQLRHAIGYDLPLYGTSQLNRNILTDGQEPDPIGYLDGVRLLEIPWQLQRDHPAVMIYPRLIQEGEQKRSADLERLYALGIDAYRVARALALKPGKGFELDGVTGKLQINIKKDVYSFERISPSAIYRQGRIQLLNPNPQ